MERPQILQLEDQTEPEYVSRLRQYRDSLIRGRQEVVNESKSPGSYSAIVLLQNKGEVYSSAISGLEKLFPELNEQPKAN
jgi:hypothetical protein